MGKQTEAPDWLMGSVWGLAGSVWSQTSRTHELMSVDYMSGTVLGSMGLEIVLSDPTGQVGPVEFGDVA